MVFCMSFMPEENGDKIPVALGIKENNLYLSCVMKDGKPSLQLEVSKCQRLTALPRVLQGPLATTNFQDSQPPSPPDSLTTLRTCK